MFSSGHVLFTVVVYIKYMNYLFQVNIIRTSANPENIYNADFSSPSKRLSVYNLLLVDTPFTSLSRRINTSPLIHKEEQRNKILHNERSYAAINCLFFLQFSKWKGQNFIQAGLHGLLTIFIYVIFSRDSLGICHNSRGWEGFFGGHMIFRCNGGALSLR